MINLNNYIISLLFTLYLLYIEIYFYRLKYYFTFFYFFLIYYLLFHKNHLKLKNECIIRIFNKKNKKKNIFFIKKNKIKSKKMNSNLNYIT
jgi:hypothetical protein